MQTHLQLIYEQLDMLTSFLVEETGMLFAEPAMLNDWQRDDIHALAYAVDATAEGFLTAPQRLQEGYSLVQVGDELLGALHEVLERSAALLYDDTLPVTCSQRLQPINRTAYDMVAIVSEIFDL